MLKVVFGFLFIAVQSGLGSDRGNYM